MTISPAHDFDLRSHCCRRCGRRMDTLAERGDQPCGVFVGSGTWGDPAKFIPDALGRPTA